MARKGLQKCVTLRVQAIAADPSIDAPLRVRLLLHTMAHVANSVTGASYVGQAALAARMNSNERDVRRSLEWLDEQKAFPVRVVRTARFREDGRGRTSDLWKLVVQPDTTSGYSSDQPDTTSAKPSRLTGQGSTTNRTPRHDQPDMVSGDLTEGSDGVILRSNSASTSDAGSYALATQGSGEPSKPKKAAQRKPSKRTRTKPATVDPEQGSKHAEVVAAYFSRFEAVRGEKPVFGARDGAAVKKLLDQCGGDADKACRAITGAFVSWKADTVTIRQIAENPSEFIGAQSGKRANGRATMQPSRDDDNFTFEGKVI